MKIYAPGIVVIILLSQLVACNKNDQPPPTPNPTKIVALNASSFSENSSAPQAKMTTVTPDEQNAITQAITAYLIKQNTPLAQTTVITIDKRDGDYVRAHLQPTSPTGDAATAFVQYQGNQWQVLSVGTAFDFNFYLQNSIPQDLILKKQR